MLRIACIGAGGRGRLCKLAHRPEQQSQLVAVCDPVEKVRAEYAEQYPGIAVFDDFKQMLAAQKYDAVFVSSPDFLHEEHAIAALSTGAAVYLEKPLAITLSGADRILATAAAHGDRLYLGHNMRFFPVVLKMRELIASGCIGKVQAIWCRHFIDYGGDAYFKDWHSERRFTTGLLLQKGAHDIDVIHFLAGSHTRRVVGMGKLSVYDRVPDRRPADERGDPSFNTSHWPPLSQKKLSPSIDVEDHSMILMQLESGAQASYQQCHYTPDGWRNYTVIGDAGRIENWGDSSSEKCKATVRVYDKRTGGWNTGSQEIVIEPISGTHGGADPQIVSDFLSFVRTGKRNGATPWDARQAVAVGYLGTRSLREGNVPFDVPPLGLAERA